MNHANNLREISRQLLAAGKTLQADECSEAAAELDRLLAILSQPPTWLCDVCRGQWLIRDGSEVLP
jgi:hypothetical protein